MEIKTACREASEKHLFIAVSEQVFAWKLFQNRFWSHRHHVTGTIFFPWVLSRVRSSKFSRLAHQSVQHMWKTHVLSLQLSDTCRSIGLLATDVGLCRLIDHVAYKEKQRNIKKCHFFCPASIYGSFSHAQTATLHEAIWSCRQISVDILSLASTATQLQAKRVQAHEVYWKQNKVMLKMLHDCNFLVHLMLISVKS